jgi:hypothetical protein
MSRNEIVLAAIDTHFTNWADAGDVASGFTSWAWDTREETAELLLSLSHGDEVDTESLIDAIAYSVSSHLEVESEEVEAVAEEWLRDNARHLHAALADCIDA